MMTIKYGLQICFELTDNDGQKLTSDAKLPCRAANDYPILACAANDFTVSHETNSLPGNKMYVARLKKFSLQ
jgi:hypothetical protein